MGGGRGERGREDRNINVTTVTVHGLDHECYSAMLYFHITIRQMSCDINTINLKILLKMYQTHIHMMKRGLDTNVHHVAASDDLYQKNT